MSINKTLSCEASSSQQNKEGNQCESIDSQKEEHQDLDVNRTVSPAISHAAANERELKKPISNASKSCNKSGNQFRSSKPDCYSCKWKGSTDWSAHSSCNHPIFNEIEGSQFLPVMYMIKGLKSPFEKILNITYNQHGFNMGWFMWPINFDPVWLESCDGFEEKDND